MGVGKGSGSTFLILLFVLTITFCLVSAGIFKANTTIGMNAAYAKKSKESSGGSSGSDGGGSKNISIHSDVAILSPSKAGSISHFLCALSRQNI